MAVGRCGEFLLSVSGSGFDVSFTRCCSFACVSEYIDIDHWFVDTQIRLGVFEPCIYFRSRSLVSLSRGLWLVSLYSIMRYLVSYIWVRLPDL